MYKNKDLTKMKKIEISIVDYCSVKQIYLWLNYDTEVVSLVVASPEIIKQPR